MVGAKWAAQRQLSLSLSSWGPGWRAEKPSSLVSPWLLIPSKTLEFLPCQALKRASHFLELDGLT